MENEANIQTNMDAKTAEIVAALQKEIVDILEEMIRVFDKHNLKYSLVAGSLLGAIRHKGFIPWDDDLDIIMPREDFEKFRQVAKTELRENFFFQDYTTDKEYPSIVAKVRNSSTTLIENGYRNLRKMNHGIFVDIFVTDKYKTGRVNAFRRKIIKFYALILLLQKTADVKWPIRTICRLFPRNALFKEIERISVKTNKVKNPNKTITSIKCIMPSDVFDELIELPFERLKVKVSSKYHEMLSDMFGDYMQLPPVDKRVPKHITEHISVSVPYEEYINQQT